MSMYRGNPGPLQKLQQLYQLTKQRSREGHLSAPRQWAEMLWLKLRYGIGPAYYHVATFWRRDIPFAEKRRHLGADEYSKRVEALNPHVYRKLSQNKVAEKAILNQFGVPTPRFLGWLHPTRGLSVFGAPLRCVGDVGRLLEESRVDRLCLKRVEGWGGSGFRAISVRADAGAWKVCPLFESAESPLAEYLQSFWSGNPDGWVIEEYLEQHEQMRTFNPTSVNTIRMWVLQRGSADPTFLGAYLRIGRGGALVDNQSSGGIIAKIEPASGELRAATDGHVAHPVFAAHPDHGAPIEGQRIPCWSQAIELAKSTLRLFPNVRFAGFDIAVCPRGPVVIELNVLPDLQGAAEMDLPLRDVLLP
jgi:Sugar-transfer associated ATP-grasp